MTRFLQARRRMLYDKDLPLVGPFASLQGFRSSNLGDFTTRFFFTFTPSDSARISWETRPLKYNNFVINTNQLLISAYKLDWFWCNKAVINGAITAPGEIGAYTSEGGNGGAGGSGGGGGTYIAETGDGGSSGGDGTTTSATYGGTGYLASGEALFDPIAYSYGVVGGDGAAGGQGSYWYEGLGGTAKGTIVGAGGGGGGSGGATGEEIGAGGGGGGGFFCLVCNDLSGTGAFYVPGGVGGDDDIYGSVGGGGGGGGGCVWIAARKYSGTLTVDVSGGIGGNSIWVNGGDGAPGQAAIYEITKNNTLVLRAFNESWNNL